MSNVRKVDTSTLGWVKSEIEEALKQARLELEAYAASPAETTRLRFCITHLHQVFGTLQMVELDGAAMIAREIEQLAQSLLEHRAPAVAANFDVLTRAILTLPDYLTRLEYGRPDVPLPLLPLVNEMRAARGAAPFAESELFRPDLAVRPPAAPAPKPPAGDFRAAARAERAQFQLALLEWLRAPSTGTALARLGGVLDRLQAQAPAGTAEQLFWVAGGLIEALARGDLEPSTARKKLLSRLDQQIRQLTGAAPAARAAGESLVKAMLLEVAQLPAPGPRGAELRRAFELDELLGSAPPDRGDDLHQAPTPEALQSVAAALGQEIERAQDLLSAYFDPAQEDVHTLAPLIEVLHRIGGTLQMLGVEPLRTLVNELGNLSRAIEERRIAEPAPLSMPMAGALLLLESSIRDIPRAGTNWQQQVADATATLHELWNRAVNEPVEGIEISDAALTDTEFRQLLGVVAAEIRVNLARVEELFETFAGAPSEVAALEPVSQHLNQIQGALHILGQDRAASLAGEANRHVQEIRAGALAVGAPVLDALAVTIGAIGAYVDGLEQGRSRPDAVLDIAARDLAQVFGEQPPTADPAVLLESIAGGFARWLAAGSGETGRADTASSLARLAALAAAAGETRCADLAGEMQRLLTVLGEDRAPVTGEIRHTLSQSLEALSGLVRARWGQPAALPAAERLVVARTDAASEAPAGELQGAGRRDEIAGGEAARDELMDELDSEIMQIFIEDARETLMTIDERLEQWRTDPADREALLELRRGFHTLKGSGRMVGATEIAELAWGIENVLNQVREGRLSFDPELLVLVEDARVALPELIAHLEGGPPARADVAALRARADAFARRASESMPEPQAARAAPARAERALPPPPEPRLDPALVQIYSSETRGHLDTIRRILEEARAAGGSCPVTEPLLRAAHTLQGGSRSLGFAAQAECCAEMEKMLHAAAHRQAPLDEARLELIGRMVDGIEEVLEGLAGGLTPGPELQQEFTELAGQFARDHAPPSKAAPKAPPLAPAEIFSPNYGAARATGTGDRELMEVFIEEAADLLSGIESALARWRGNRADHAPADDLLRLLHTLKGGARMAGARAVADLGHNTESLLRRVADGRIPDDPGLIDLLEEVHDALLMMIDRLQTHGTATVPNELASRLTALMGGAPGDTMSPDEAWSGAAEAEPEAPGTEAAARSGAARVNTVALRAPAPMGADATDTAGAGGRKGEELIRVRTGLLNTLVNYAGEVSIARSRVQQQIHGFRDGLGELRGNIRRFRDQIRELDIQSESQILYRAEGSGGRTEFDPLELDRYSRLQQVSRSLSESLHDLFTIQSNLDNFIGQAETALQQQARIGTELQEGLTRTRMVGFSSQAARLRHIVRTTARELGKQVELSIRGGDVEIDRNVLERMIGPFEHMIRNAVDHGIESPEARERAGKPAAATITIDIRHDGSEVVIRFSDDGAGIDIAAIRDKAMEQGLIRPGVKLVDSDLIQFILLAGFSTAGRVTQLSGRGIGMDVVHNEVKQLGGSMTVETRAGEGTSFTVRLPLTLSIIQGLMVYSDDQLFALPMSAVANILEVPVQTLKGLSMGRRPLFSHEGEVFPFLHLGARLGLPVKPPARRKVPVLLVKSAGRTLALQVDRLGGTQELVIKPLGPQLAELDALAGASILGDGRVVLILNTTGLWLTEELMAPPPAPAEVAPPAAAGAPASRPLVMVVDDSITVRKVTGRHLHKRGMEVITAKDGIEALELLRERIPDVMLVDIEMPRMDGYELTTTVRADPLWRHIPIIIVTSRSGAKHRERALQMGVNLYMTKPYQEEELFRNIDSLLAHEVAS